MRDTKKCKQPILSVLHMSLFCYQAVGMLYLHEVLKPIINRIFDEKKYIELDPCKINLNRTRYNRLRTHPGDWCSTNWPLNSSLLTVLSHKDELGSIGCHFLFLGHVTALLSLLHGSEKGHECAPTDFLSWSDDNFLDVNVSKTKELIIDFRHNKGITR